jgi:uncharacterized membrane protein YkgB
LGFDQLHGLGHGHRTERELNGVSRFGVTPVVPFAAKFIRLIGVCFLFRRTLPIALSLMGLQIIGTILPLVFLPEICYAKFPFVLTLEGQYIVKNVVLIAAAIVLGSQSYRGCSVRSRLAE